MISNKHPKLCSRARIDKDNFTLKDLINFCTENSTIKCSINELN